MFEMLHAPTFLPSKPLQPVEDIVWLRDLHVSRRSSRFCENFTLLINFQISSFLSFSNVIVYRSLQGSGDCIAAPGCETSLWSFIKHSWIPDLCLIHNCRLGYVVINLLDFEHNSAPIIFNLEWSYWHFYFNCPFLSNYIFSNLLWPTADFQKILASILLQTTKCPMTKLKAWELSSFLWRWA